MRAAFYKATRPGIPGLYNRLVRAIDGGPYSHAELVFSDGACWSASWMDEGVRGKTFEMDPAKWDLIELPAHWDEAATRRWFEERAGQPYDTGGNLKFVWHWWPQSDRAWFCTEAMAAALNAACPALGWVKPWWFGPRKLHSELVKLTQPA